MFWKRGILIGLALVLVLGCFAGCAQGSQNTPGTDDGDITLEEYTLPLTDTPVTITFATVENPAATVSYNDKLPVWEELEKRTGVVVEFQVVPDVSNYEENIQTRLAAGINLPDVMRLPANPMQYADSGVIVPLTNLIAQYAPNIIQLYDDRPEIKTATTAPDGNIYYISSITNARSIVNYATTLYRQDWVDALNLDDPETIEDWYNMLTAFKENDMNGNGDKNDEIPFSAAFGRYIYSFAWAYGVMLDPNESGAECENWQLTDDGKVEYVWTADGIREWLTEMNKWYSEGLIDRDLFSDQGSDKFTAKVTGELAGTTVAFSMNTPQWTTNMTQENPDVYWEVAYPPVGPGGQAILRERPVSSENFAISRDCKDTALVMKWLDYIYANREGQILIGNFGIEGFSFEYDENDHPVFTEMIAGDPRGDGIAIYEIGANGPFPRILMTETIQNRFMHFPQAENASDAMAKYAVESFPNIIATSEENSRIVSLLADIDTYRKTMIVKFILGTEPLENYDSYVAKFDELKLPELLALKQEQYDRVSG